MGSPPRLRVENAYAQDSFQRHSASVMASTGVASTKMMLVAYIDQMNSGRRNQVMPGASHFVNRHDEIQPGEDGTEPGDENAGDGQHDMGVAEGAAVRGVKRPAGIDAAEDQRTEGERIRRICTDTS